MNVFVVLSLPIIGYMIGGHLHLEIVRKEWKKIFWITILQGLCGAALFVPAVTFLSSLFCPISGATLYSAYLPMALLVGAVAWATAPGVTLSILRERKAEGAGITTILASGARVTS